VLTINNSGKFILFELPFVFIPPGTDKFIFNLKVNGIVPILAHVERISAFQKSPELLEQLVNIGALVQINAHGLTKGQSPGTEMC
jgi:Capsular polysaccharide biosynthesis protein